MGYYYDKQLILLKETDGYMYHGSWVEGKLEPFKTITCDVQPANREQIYKDYGYFIDCSKRVFCDIDIDIKLGMFVQYNDETYKIVKLIEWDDYFDMFLEVSANV